MLYLYNFIVLHPFWLFALFQASPRKQKASELAFHSISLFLPYDNVNKPSSHFPASTSFCKFSSFLFLGYFSISLGMRASVKVSREIGVKLLSSPQLKLARRPGDERIKMQKGQLNHIIKLELPWLLIGNIVVRALALFSSDLKSFCCLFVCHHHHSHSFCCRADTRKKKKASSPCLACLRVSRIEIIINDIRQRHGAK